MRIYICAVIIFLNTLSLLIADTIYLKNSVIIRGKVIQITEKIVEYSEENGRPFLTIPKEEVLEIEFGNDKDKRKPVETIPGHEEVKEIKQAPVNVDRILDSYFRLSFFAGIAFFTGNIAGKENQAYKDNYDQFRYIDDSLSFEHYGYTRGLSLDFMPPQLTAKINHSALKGINSGIKTVYVYTTVRQHLGNWVYGDNFSGRA